MDQARELFRRFSPPDSEILSVVLSFVVSLVMAPLSSGIWYFIIYTLFYEACLFYTTAGLTGKWQIEVRVGNNCAAFTGWILGRWLLTGSTECEATSDWVRYFLS